MKEFGSQERKQKFIKVVFFEKNAENQPSISGPL